MDFSLSDEQLQLKDIARRFFSDRLPSSVVRTISATEHAHDSGLWREMAANGWMAIGIPEEYDGIGAITELAVVLEEAGRALLPGPYFSTMGLALPVLLAAADSEQKRRLLPGVAQGDLVGTLALTEASARWDAQGVGLRATLTNAGWLLNGSKRFVPDAAVADFIVVAARTGDLPQDMTLFLVEGRPAGLDVGSPGTLDETRRWCDLRFDNVHVSAGALMGQVNGGWSQLAAALEWSSTALSAEMVGGMEWVLDTAVAYAKERKQFGRAIGSYQAVSHRLATSLLELESSRSATYYAAWAVETGAPGHGVFASMAKAYASDAFRKATWCGIQTLGGIGFTWEHDMQLYFKRAKASELLLGDATFHRERVAQSLALTQ